MEEKKHVKLIMWVLLKQAAKKTQAHHAQQPSATSL
jgi:hypothetical protein